MVKRITKADKSAAAIVLDYAQRYMANRGLVATFPRLVVGMMPELSGWPVRNADGGSNIAHFTTYDAAHNAIVAADRATRAGRLSNQPR